MNDNFNTVHNDDLTEISSRIKMPGVHLLTINEESVNLRKDAEIRANITRRTQFETLMTGLNDVEKHLAESHEKRSSES